MAINSSFIWSLKDINKAKGNLVYPSAGFDIEYIVVGGGGAGGSTGYPVPSPANGGRGGGGGGGGFLTNEGSTAFPVISGITYSVTIGAGGTVTATTGASSGANTIWNVGNQGGANSVLAWGGGGGGGYANVTTFGVTRGHIGRDDNVKTSYRWGGNGASGGGGGGGWHWGVEGGDAMLVPNIASANANYPLGVGANYYYFPAPSPGIPVDRIGGPQGWFGGAGGGYGAGNGAGGGGGAGNYGWNLLQDQNSPTGLNQPYNNARTSQGGIGRLGFDGNYYGGGGGGGLRTSLSAPGFPNTNAQANTTIGAGGLGGGGNGAYWHQPTTAWTSTQTTPAPTGFRMSAGTANRGGGGGGSISDDSIPNSVNVSGMGGGSGVVILRYLATNPDASGTTGSPSLSVSGGYKYYTFTASGTIFW
jgi:hypothetical protein